MIKLAEIGATHHADGSADRTTRNRAHQREDIWTKELRFAHCTHVTHCPQLTPGKWNGDGRHGPETTSLTRVGAHIALHACHAPPLKAVLSCCTATDPGHAGLISTHTCFAHCTHVTHYSQLTLGKWNGAVDMVLRQMRSKRLAHMSCTAHMPRTPTEVGSQLLYPDRSWTCNAGNARHAMHALHTDYSPQCIRISRRQRMAPSNVGMSGTSRMSRPTRIARATGVPREASWGSPPVSVPGLPLRRTRHAMHACNALHALHACHTLRNRRQPQKSAPR